MIKILSKLFKINKKIIILESYPDFSDSIFELYKHLLKTYPSYEYYWICDSKNKNKAQNKGIKKIIFFFNSCNLFQKVKTFIVTSKAKYFLVSNRVFLHFKKDGQIVLFFNHGQPFKKVSNYNFQIDKWIDYIVSNNKFTSDLYFNNGFFAGKKALYMTNLRLGLFNLKEQQRFSLRRKLSIPFENKIIVFAFTFKLNANEETDVVNLLPSGFCYENMRLLDEFAARQSVSIVFKLHPSIKKPLIYARFTNIIFLTEDNLQEKDIIFYNLLGESFCLVTDYSSVFIDYYSTLKPIVFYCAEYNEVLNKNKALSGDGFMVDNPRDYMAGPLCWNFTELFDSLKSAINGDDIYLDQKKKMNDLWNKSPCEYDEVDQLLFK